jgi:hypothetical protein
MGRDGLKLDSVNEISRLKLTAINDCLQAQA